MYCTITVQSPRVAPLCGMFVVSLFFIKCEEISVTLPGMPVSCDMLSFESNLYSLFQLIVLVRNVFQLFARCSRRLTACLWLTNGLILILVNQTNQNQFAFCKLI
uniref:Uncharacterized protein n=1 Tax=Rhipicephalus microplus TaxID=6941 RepID=A0A6G5AFN6_RHIMP